MENLKGLKILITGADGFIGSHLTEMALQAGARVRVLCQYNSFGNIGWLEEVEQTKELDIIVGDIRDQRCCLTAVDGVDIVFNLAALIAIPYSYSAPESYLQTNVIGTFNICEAIRQSDGVRLVHMSTSEVYGSAQYVPIDEKHPISSQSPYSASKVGADAIVQSFVCSYNLDAVIARPFNTFGPRQSARAVIPAVIIQIGVGMQSIELGDVSPTRDFNFVYNTCLGILQLGLCGEATGQAVNIGSGKEISILDTFNLIKKLMSSNVELKFNEARARPKKSEVMRLVCDNTKIRGLTGFEPPIDLEEGLAVTIEWFRNPANLSRYKSQLYNV